MNRLGKNTRELLFFFGLVIVFSILIAAGTIIIPSLKGWGSAFTWALAFCLTYYGGKYAERHWAEVAK